MGSYRISFHMRDTEEEKELEVERTVQIPKRVYVTFLPVRVTPKKMLERMPRTRSGHVHYVKPSVPCDKTALDNSY